MELNNIYLGDCYELIKQVPDKSIDLIITDPPYEIVYGGSAGCFGKDKRKYHNEYNELSTNEHSNIKGNNCNGFDYSLLNELDRVMKKINIYIWCNKTQISSLMKHYEDKGVNVDLLVWHKTNPVPTCNNKYLSDLEYCVFARENGVAINGTYETKSKLFETTTNKIDKDLYLHPTIKPIENIKKLIINSSEVEDVVLDVFSGSGTTCAAAKELNRKYLGFEINEQFYKISIDRLRGICANDKKINGCSILDEDLY